MRQNKDADNCQCLLHLSPVGLRLRNEAKEDPVFFSKCPSLGNPGLSEMCRSEEQQ